MSVPDICLFTTTFSTQGAAPLRRLMSSTRACSVSAPSSPTGIVVAMRSSPWGSYYILHRVCSRCEADMIDHRTRILHDEVRERELAVPRRTLGRLILVPLLLAAVLG